MDDRRLRAAQERAQVGEIKRRWRFWESKRGIKAVADEIDALPAEDALSIHAQMTIVRQEGTQRARHLVEDIYEVEAHGIDRSYRLLFSPEGKKERILLALVLLEKASQKTPKKVIRLAQVRRDRWRDNPSRT